jgi:protocatechuate 3,4-dioxygenase beta subunit
LNTIRAFLATFVLLSVLAPQSQLAASASCTATTPATPAETEGPYYKAGSPERATFVEGETAGTKLVVTGTVFSRGDCKPITGAWLDFWQADDKGSYDNVGQRFRGHQTTDGAGKYVLRTVLPGLYPGRTRHIHVKVRTPAGTALTTQIYFPGEPRNQSDGLFNAALLADLRDGVDGKVATFTFIIDGH